jgi:uncharacterized membrane protein
MSDDTAVSTTPAAGAGTSTAPRRKRNKAAMFSFVLSVFGVVSVLILFAAPSVIGIVLGLVGLHRIRKAGGTQKGTALAVAGICLGLLSIAFAVALFDGNPCLLHPNSPVCTDKYLG